MLGNNYMTLGVSMLNISNDRWLTLPLAEYFDLKIFETCQYSVVFETLNIGFDIAFFP